MCLPLAEGTAFSHLKHLVFKSHQTGRVLFTLGLRKAEGYCRHPSVCLSVRLSVRPLHMIIQ